MQLSEMHETGRIKWAKDNMFFMITETATEGVL